MATMQDVATAAGVSLSTVSYVINGTRPISAPTRARVEAAMASLNYSRNAAARTLASRKSRTIAVILPSAHALVGWTLSQIVASAAAAAHERDYELTVWPGLGSAADDAAQITRLAAQGGVDGALLLEVLEDDARIDALRNAALPTVLLGRPHDVAGLTCIDIDFDACVRDAIELLMAQGHRRIAFINQSTAHRDQGYGPSVRAHRAYLAAAGEHGLADLHLWCEPSARAGRDALDELLAASAPDGRGGVTAVIVMNEAAALGVLAQARRRGLSVPEELSVLGIATSQAIAAFAEPPLSVFEVPAHEMAHRAVNRLIDSLDGAALDGDSNMRRPGGVVELLACVMVPGGTVGSGPALRHTLAPQPRTTTPHTS